MNVILYHLEKNFLFLVNSFIFNAQHIALNYLSRMTLWGADTEEKSLFYGSQ